MKSQTGNTFLKYDIFKNSSNDRWGSGNERWSSLNATINPGVHNGVTQQNYVFTTKLLMKTQIQYQRNLSRYGHGTSRVLKAVL